jgi:hypothetical protein
MPSAMGIIEIELCLGSTSHGPFYFGNAQGLKCYPTLGKMFSGTYNQMWLNLLVDDLSSSGTCTQMWLNLLVDDLSSSGTCTQMWLNLLVDDLQASGPVTKCG